MGQWWLAQAIDSHVLYPGVECRPTKVDDLSILDLWVQGAGERLYERPYATLV
jgi:hypothetical protein